MYVYDCNKELNVLGKQLKPLAKCNTKKEFRLLAKSNNRQLKQYARSFKLAWTILNC